MNNRAFIYLNIFKFYNIYTSKNKAIRGRKKNTHTQTHTH